VIDVDAVLAHGMKQIPGIKVRPLSHLELLAVALIVADLNLHEVAGTTEEAENAAYRIQCVAHGEAWRACRVFARSLYGDKAEPFHTVEQLDAVCSWAHSFVVAPYLRGVAA
jgi:hypothetical protein